MPGRDGCLYCTTKECKSCQYSELRKLESVCVSGYCPIYASGRHYVHPNAHRPIHATPRWKCQLYMTRHTRQPGCNNSQMPSLLLYLLCHAKFLAESHFSAFEYLHATSSTNTLHQTQGDTREKRRTCKSCCCAGSAAASPGSSGRATSHSPSSRTQRRARSNPARAGAGRR